MTMLISTLLHGYISYTYVPVWYGTYYRLSIFFTFLTNFKVQSSASLDTVVLLCMHYNKDCHILTLFSIYIFYNSHRHLFEDMKYDKKHIMLWVYVS